MPWYKTGTVSVTLNSNAVTGTGSAFIVNCRVGDAFRGPDGRWYEVTNVASNTAIAIDPPYLGTTTSSGSYALAPMQGYVKDSADALRAIVTTYGAQLAALKTTGNYDILPPSKGGTGITDLSVFIQGMLNDPDAAAARLTLAAAKTGANSDITSLTGLTTALSMAQGGTGANSQAAARTNLGLKSAAVADLVGTVSQSGGTPTGAIIESGSNSNGQYTKYADGTMICSHVVRMDTVLTADILGGTWTFPMPFASSTVHISHSPMQGSSADCAPALTDRFGPVLTAPSGTAASLRSIKRTGGAGFVAGNFIDTHVIAKGRWF